MSHKSQIWSLAAAFSISSDNTETLWRSMFIGTTPSSISAEIRSDHCFLQNCKGLALKPEPLPRNSEL